MAPIRIETSSTTGPKMAGVAALAEIFGLDRSGLNGYRPDNEAMEDWLKLHSRELFRGIVPIDALNSKLHMSEQIAMGKLLITAGQVVRGVPVFAKGVEPGTTMMMLENDVVNVIYPYRGGEVPLGKPGDPTNGGVPKATFQHSLYSTPNDTLMSCGYAMVEVVHDGEKLNLGAFHAGSVIVEYVNGFRMKPGMSRYFTDEVDRTYVVSGAVPVKYNRELGLSPYGVQLWHHPFGSHERDIAYLGYEPARDGMYDELYRTVFSQGRGIEGSVMASLDPSGSLRQFGALPEEMAERLRQL